jgi:hypothetical protein
MKMFKFILPIGFGYFTLGPVIFTLALVLLIFLSAFAGAVPAVVFTFLIIAAVTAAVLRRLK